MANNIYAQADEFRAAIARWEQMQADTLTARYQVVLDALEPLINDLCEQIEAARAEGKPVNKSWLFREARYKSLMEQVESELGRFGRTARRVIEVSQTGAINRAATYTETLLQAAEVPGANFNRLPTAAFENVVGYLGDGSPLASILDKLPRDGKKAVSDALVRGVALGWNPRKSARAAMNAADVPRDRALTICRTETLRAYRQAAISSYEENEDVVTGWRWLAALSSRSCAMCIAMHGTIHKNSERFGSHPNCRCVPSPVVIGTEDEEFETGADWFAKQNEAAQDTILGSRTAGDVYRNGGITLSDFVGERQSDGFGLTRYAKSLNGAKS